MQRRAGPEGQDGPVGAALVPGAAGVGPDGALHEVVLVLDKVLDGLLLGRELGNVGRLVAVDDLAHPVGLGLDGGEDGAVADGAVGAEEDEVVGVVGGRDAEVGLGLRRPLVLQVLALGVDHGEARLEGGVEAGGADEDVKRILLAVVAEAALLSDGVDLSVDDLHIRLGQRLEVVDTRGESSASNAPGGDELVLEELVVEFLLHLRKHVLVGIEVDLVVLEEDAELGVETSLDALAVLGQNTGLVVEVVQLLLCEEMLLQSLDGRDPSGFSDEGGDLFAVFSDGGKDLDTR